jgi:tRNA threonylcarbamoyladenosine biosynthesis protein TsaB
VALHVDGCVATATPEQVEARADDAASLADGLLRAAGLGAADLTGIGVTIGPGSYTGVRIGLALVRGLSLVDRIPVVGTGTLELLAAAAPGADPRVFAVLDAGADKLYVALFERADGGMRQLLEPRVVGRSQLAALIDAEAGAAVLVRSQDEPQVICNRPVLAVPGADRLAALVQLSARRLRQGGGSSADLVLPLYVGATGARPNRNKVVTAAFADE